MKITEIISLVEARLNSLRTSYTLATSSGDLNETFRLEEEISETEETLENLKKLS